MTPIEIFMTILLAMCVIERSAALSCPCWRYQPTLDDPRSYLEKYCPSDIQCPEGSTVIHDACGCCEACSKIEGELCGGPWYTSGYCTEGLECINPRTKAPVTSFRMAEGTCTKPDFVISAPSSVSSDTPFAVTSTTPSAPSSVSSDTPSAVTSTTPSAVTEEKATEAAAPLVMVRASRQPLTSGSRSELTKKERRGRKERKQRKRQERKERKEAKQRKQKQERKERKNTQILGSNEIPVA